MKKITKILFVMILALTGVAMLFAMNNPVNKVKAVEIPAGQTLDTNVDEISISDLTIKGVKGYSTLNEYENTDVSFSFSEENVNKNIVFKFKYVVNNPADVKSDQTSLRIHFDVADDKWDVSNSFMIRPDKTFLRYWKEAETKFSWNEATPALSNGTYEIEYGRIALLDGEGKATGKYYVYYKIDDNDEVSFINPYDLSKMDNTMFLNIASKTNRIYDIDATYEDAQWVSVDDLMLNGEYIGKDKVANKDVTYDYEGSTENNSVVFVAKVDYKAAQDSQIYITTQKENWNYAGFVWLCADKVRFAITKADGTFDRVEDVSFASALVAGSEHQIEYGRLAVVKNNKFTGVYYVYFKLDGTLVYSTEQPVVGSVAKAGAIHLTGNAGFDYVNLPVAPTSYTAVVDKTELTLNKILTLGTSDAKVEFDSSMSEVKVDFYNNEKVARITNVQTLTGTEVQGVNGNYYHYSISLSDLNTNEDFSNCVISSMRFRGAYDYANFRIFGGESYETPDVISVSDLKLDDTYAGTSVIFSQNNKFSYNATAEHKSVVFKFIYEVNAATDMSNQFHFSDNYLENNGGTIWLRSDKTFLLKTYTESAAYIERSALNEVKNYNIEMGKLYITSGANAGKYYIYMKADGKLVTDYLIASMPDKANIFTTGKNLNHMYDINYSYEEAKEISIGDLELEDKDVSNVWNIKSHAKLTYDNEDHADHYSLVFKFKYVVKENKQNQFHLTANGKAEGTSQDYIWDQASSFILGNGDKGNRMHVGKSTATSTNAGWYDNSFDLTVGTTYNVELGRKAIMNGDEFTGKYYVYIMIDNKLVKGDAMEIPQAVVEGNVVFVTSDGKNILQDVDFVDCDGSHTLGDAVAAVAETCDKDGNVKYYWCSNCGKYFSDAEGTTELSTVVVAKHHTIVEVPAVAEDCDTDGNIKYYECSACHKLFSDNAATTEITAASTVIAKHHTLNEVPAVAETCDTDGNIKYYECSACHKLFSDDTAATEITAASTVVAKHHNIIKVDALPESCSSNGYIEHYTCTACGEIYSDAAGTTVITAESLVVAKHHTVRKVEAKDATCSAAGNVEYYHCSACNKNFSNEAATSELATVATAMLEHTFKRGTCTVCGAEDPEYKGLFSGCKSAVSVTGIVGLFALTGLFFAKKKREEE